VRQGEGGKGEQQVRFRAPCGGEAVVTAEEEDKVAGVEFRLTNEFGEAG
jgi:hypothetical protein